MLLGDFYPSGDEYELVYTATGRLIPAAGIPLQVGCVVNNVETLYNVHSPRAASPSPQIRLRQRRGAQPKSFWVPVGTPFRELAGTGRRRHRPDFGMFVSGIMMGTLSFDLDDVVTKTTGGLIVLPRDHYLIARKTRPQEAMHRIGKSACDQCSYCTEFCPRYLLGYEVVPHKVMRSLGFTLTGGDKWNQWGELCCACGLCTLYACPEDLYPKEACDQAKDDLRAAGIKFVQKKPVEVHPMKEYRRVPLSMLRQRLKVDEYEADAPFEDIADEAQGRAHRMAEQHAGKPAVPSVREGDSLRTGDSCRRASGEANSERNVHASIDGRVAAVSDQHVEISR